MMKPSTPDTPDFDAEAAVGLDYASFPRRLGALLIDWIACSAVNFAIFGAKQYSESAATGWLTLGIFLLESAIGTALVGASFGQLVTRIRVLRIRDGRPLSLLDALLRSALICVLIPPLVFRPETGRGLHDLWTGAAAFRLGRRTK